jgi:hypothetical protein
MTTGVVALEPALLPALTIGVQIRSDSRELLLSFTLGLKGGIHVGLSLAPSHC